MLKLNPRIDNGRHTILSRSRSLFLLAASSMRGRKSNIVAPPLTWYHSIMGLGVPTIGQFSFTLSPTCATYRSR